MARPISLSHLTVLELTPLQLVEVAARSGYEAVDVRLAPATPNDRVYPVFGDAPMLRELKQRLDDTGIRVFDVEIIRVKRNLDVASYEPLFTTAAILGAQRIKVVSDEPDEAALVDVLSRLCETAAPFGLTIDLEFMRFTEAKTIAQAMRIVRAVRNAHRNCCVLVDTLHFDRSGAQIADLDSLDQSLFHYLQLCDAPAQRPVDNAGLIHEARNARLVPGAGALPLVAILRQFPADCPISLEIPMAALAEHMGALERAKRCIEATRELLSNLERE